jgi:hypothetical protein
MSNVDLDVVLDELRAKITERRRLGQYPEGMEQQLESEFAHMMRAIHRDEVDTTRLNHLVEAVGHSVHAVDAVVPAPDSRYPGGSAVHSATARMVQRHTGQLASSVREFGGAVTSALDETRRLVEAQRSADERQLLDAISGVLDRLAVLDHLVEIARDLDDRMAAIEARLPADT